MKHTNIKKENKQKNKRYSKKVIFWSYITLIIISLQLYPSNNVVLGLDTFSIEIEPSPLKINVVSGEVTEYGFTVKNFGGDDFEYEVSFSSNLEWDEHTVGLWTFNEGQGEQVLDSSPYGNHGMVYGATWVNGKFGKALRFNGIDNYVLIQNSSSLNVPSVTMEAWVRPQSIEGTVPLGAVKFWEYGLLCYDTGIIRPHVWANGLKWYDTYAELEINEWNYLALTFNANTGLLSWYLNGVKIESRYEGLSAIQASEYPLIIGRAWTEQMWNFYSGDIDEIRLSDVARTEEEIHGNYVRGVSGSGELVSVPKGIMNIPPGSTQEIIVHVNAEYLSPGIYLRELSIQSTSPLGPVIVLPVELNIEPANHDIAVTSLYVPELINANELVKIEVNIKNQGTLDEIKVRLYLEINGKELDYKMIDFLGAGENYVTSFWWVPEKSGYYLLKVSLEDLPNESNVRNNFISRLVSVEGYPKINLEKESIEITCNSTSNETYELVIDNTGSNILTFFLYDEYSEVLFYDEMETGQGSWAHYGQFDDWQLGQPSLGPESTASGTNCWGTGLNTYYRDNSDASLVTPQISLVGRSVPELSFWTWYDIDSVGDRGYVEIYDGGSWVRVNGNGLYGYSQGWQRVAYDLSGFIGRVVQIRFRFVSDGYFTGKGWYIDDVKIIDLVEPVDDYFVQSPRSGRIDAGGSRKITLTVKTQHLIEQDTYDHIYINNNDPNSPLIIIPIKIIMLDYVEKNQTEVAPLTLIMENEIVINEDEPYTFIIHNVTGGVEPYSYEWKVYDSDNLVFYEKQPTHTFNDPGIYNATLTVIDTISNNVKVDQKIIVLDTTPPTAIAGSDLNTTVNLVNIFNATGSYDNIGIRSFVWDFGDGTSASGAIVYHTYLNEGTYTVTLTAEDEAKNVGVDIIYVIVRPAILIEYDSKKDTMLIDKLLLYLMVTLSLVMVVFILITLKSYYFKKI